MAKDAYDTIRRHEEDELISRVVGRMAGGQKSLTTQETAKRWAKERLDARKALKQRLAKAKTDEEHNRLHAQLEMITTPTDREREKPLAMRLESKVPTAVGRDLARMILHGFARTGSMALKTLDIPNRIFGSSRSVLRDMYDEIDENLARDRYEVPVGIQPVGETAVSLATAGAFGRALPAVFGANVGVDTYETARATGASRGEAAAKGIGHGVLDTAIWTLGQGLSSRFLPESWQWLGREITGAMRGASSSVLSDAMLNSFGADIPPEEMAKRAAHAAWMVPILGMLKMGGKRREEAETLLRKARPELAGKKTGEVIEMIEKEFLDPKSQKVAVMWVARKGANLPDDTAQMKQALEVAGKVKGLDPMSMSPFEILSNPKFARYLPKPKPQDVKAFSNMKRYPMGVIGFDVSDDAAGREATREMINAYMSPSSNPWCLATGKDAAKLGELGPDAERYWKGHSAVPKQIFFQEVDGKLELAAFRATSPGGEGWQEYWDTSDAGYSGIPLKVKVPGDPMGRYRKMVFRPAGQKASDTVKLEPNGRIEYNEEQLHEYLDGRRRLLATFQAHPDDFVPDAISTTQRDIALAERGLETLARRKQSGADGGVQGTFEDIAPGKVFKGDPFRDGRSQTWVVRKTVDDPMLANPEKGSLLAQMVKGQAYGLVDDGALDPMSRGAHLDYPFSTFQKQIAGFAGAYEDIVDSDRPGYATVRMWGRNRGGARDYEIKIDQIPNQIEEREMSLAFYKSLAETFRNNVANKTTDGPLGKMELSPEELAEYSRRAQSAEESVSLIEEDLQALRDTQKVIEGGPGTTRDPRYQKTWDRVRNAKTFDDLVSGTDYTLVEDKVRTTENGITKFRTTKYADPTDWDYEPPKPGEQPKPMEIEESELVSPEWMRARGYDPESESDVRRLQRELDIQAWGNGQEATMAVVPTKRTTIDAETGAAETTEYGPNGQDIVAQELTKDGVPYRYEYFQSGPEGADPSPLYHTLDVDSMPLPRGGMRGHMGFRLIRNPGAGTQEVLDEIKWDEGLDSFVRTSGNRRWRIGQRGPDDADSVKGRRLYKTTKDTAYAITRSPVTDDEVQVARKAWNEWVVWANEHGFNPNREYSPDELIIRSPVVYTEDRQPDGTWAPAPGIAPRFARGGGSSDPDWARRAVRAQLAAEEANEMANRLPPPPEVIQIPTEFNHPTENGELVPYPEDDIPFALKAGHTRKTIRADEAGGDVAPDADPAVSDKPPVEERGPSPEPSAPARIVINPKVFKDKRDGLCVAYNEAFRVLMEMNGFDPQAEPTEEQRKFFSDTAYADDERMLRRTILARICTFDDSVKNPTDEQLDEALEFLETVMEIGAPQSEEEQANVQRIHDMIAEIRKAPRPEEAPVEEAPVESEAPPVGAVFGGNTRELRRRLHEQEIRNEYLAQTAGIDFVGEVGDGLRSEVNAEPSTEVSGQISRWAREDRDEEEENNALPMLPRADLKGGWTRDEDGRLPGSNWMRGADGRIGSSSTTEGGSFHDQLVAQGYLRDTSKQPAAEQPAAEQPAAEQPAAEQPAAEQPAAEQPAAEPDWGRNPDGSLKHGGMQRRDENGRLIRGDIGGGRAKGGKTTDDTYVTNSAVVMPEDKAREMGAVTQGLEHVGKDQVSIPFDVFRMNGSAVDADQLLIESYGSKEAAEAAKKAAMEARAKRYSSTPSETAMKDPESVRVVPTGTRPGPWDEAYLSYAAREGHGNVKTIKSGPFVHTAGYVPGMSLGLIPTRVLGTSSPAIEVRRMLNSQVGETGESAGNGRVVSLTDAANPNKPGWYTADEGYRAAALGSIKGWLTANKRAPGEGDDLAAVMAAAYRDKASLKLGKIDKNGKDFLASVAKAYKAERDGKAGYRDKEILKAARDTDMWEQVVGARRYDRYSSTV